MARLTFGQKGERVLKLFIALRNPRVAQALQSHGFGNDDLNEGWQLLRALSVAKLEERTPQKQSVSPSLIERLDAFENLWFPIAAATLQRRYPAAHARLFNNLSQTEGPAVAVSVATFIDRLDHLEKDERGNGWAEGKAARELLTRRGLVAKVVDEAKAMLKELPQIEPMPTVATTTPDSEHYKQAESALWAWYLEWSGVARASIKDSRLLRLLGFEKGSHHNGKSDADVSNIDPGSDDQDAATHD